MAKKKNQGKFLKQEAQQMDAAYGDMVPVQPKKRGSRSVIAVFTVLCAAVCILSGLFFLSKLGVRIALPSRTIAAGVTIAGVDVGGLKRAEAEEALASVADAYATTPLTVTVMDQQLEITPAVSGAQLDIAGVVREAAHYGTEDNPETTVDILPYLNLNTEAIMAKIEELSVLYPTDGKESGSEVLTENVDGKEQEVLAVTLGTVHYAFDPDGLYNIILRAYRNQRFTANYSFETITAETIDLDGLYAQYCTEAVDAVLDPDTHEVTQSATGYRFDLDTAKAALADAQPGDTLKFPFFEVEPAMDTETLKSMLFRDKLGSYTAYQSSSANRATNLRLACESLDGIILYPGETFSYNAALGERTPEKGYKKADSYLGSKTIQTYGGGICQPSSCLYYSVLLADLEIVERSCHGFVSSYMPKGLDATVDWDGPDFKFKNSSDFPIRIEAKADGGEVTITLIGTDTKDYYVKMESEVLSTTSPKTIYKDVKKSSGHKDGEVETTAYTGYTVQSYKLKYSKETDELISREKEAYSVYNKRDKVVYRIKEEAKKETGTDKEDTTTATEAPTTEATQAPTTAPTEAPTTAATTAPTEAPKPTDAAVGEASGDVSLPDE